MGDIYNRRGLEESGSSAFFSEDRFSKGYNESSFSSLNEETPEPERNRILPKSNYVKIDGFSTN